MKETRKSFLAIIKGKMFWDVIQLFGVITYSDYMDLSKVD